MPKLIAHVLGRRWNQVELALDRERGVQKRRRDVADHQRDMLPLTLSGGSEGQQRPGGDA
eukprot:14957317-Heterocapsa_arctica.AAC.1